MMVASPAYAVTEPNGPHSAGLRMVSAGAVWTVDWSLRAR